MLTFWNDESNLENIISYTCHRRKKKELKHYESSYLTCSFKVISY